MPQGYKKNVKFITEKVGPERRQWLLDEIDYKGTYLPNSIYYKDIDETFIDFVDNALEIEIDGTKVPVFFLTIQRWAEFSKTWTLMDKFKNLEMPFITIVRQPDVQVGENQSGMWNIPGNKLYTYLKVPTFNGGIKGMDTYKIPQPTSVDITYDVRLFCNRMKDLNLFNRTAQLTFQSRQYYINVNEHPMPVHLESIGDESKVSDFDKRRFYVQNFNMKVLGYILDEDDYELIPTVNRALIFTEILDKTIKPKIVIQSGKDADEIKITIIVKPDHFGLEFLIKCEYDIYITDLEIVENVNNVDLAINGIQQTIPFDIYSNEMLALTIDRDESKIAKLILKGTLK
tara:strand:+ start:13972 stop:15003 length:1032 start_codon:yes stop_codon:yes gene_type:complete